MEIDLPVLGDNRIGIFSGLGSIVVMALIISAADSGRFCEAGFFIRERSIPLVDGLPKLEYVFMAELPPFRANS
jgi:hypothetical protein